MLMKRCFNLPRILTIVKLPLKYLTNKANFLYCGILVLKYWEIDLLSYGNHIMDANSHNYSICIVLSLQDLKPCRTFQLWCLIAQQRPLKREQRTTKLNAYLPLFSATLSAGEHSQYFDNSVPSKYNSVPCISSFEVQPFWMTIVVSWFCRHQFVENNLILKTGVVDKRKVRGAFICFVYTLYLFKRESVSVEEPSADSCPRRGNLMFLKQMFVREAKLQNASFKNVKFSKGQLSDRKFWDINTLLSLLFTTKFSSARQFQNHVELFSTFFDKAVKAKCKIWKRKQAKTLLIQFKLQFS